ncbi:MAG: glycosyltransferase [Planctomycetota bacterium]
MTDSKAIRVLYILDRYPVRSERFIVRDIDALIKAGVDLRLVALNPLPKREWHQEAIDCGADVLRVPGRFHPINNWKRLIRWLRTGRQKIAADAPPAIRFPFRERLHLRRDAWLCGIAESMNADIIHASFATIPATLAARVSELTGIPFTVSVHARDVFIDSPRLNEKLNAASAIFACNSAVANAARERVCSFLDSRFRGNDRDANAARERVQSQEKVIDIRHPVPEAFFKRDLSVQRATGSVRFSFVGRLVEKKGLRLALSAFSDAVSRGSDIFLDIIGDGPDAGLVNTLPDSVRRRVCLKGWLDGQDYLDALTGSDSLLAPSINTASGDRDGIPNAVVEALAAGVIVIATSGGSIKDVIKDGETGVSIGATDETGMIRGLAGAMIAFDPADVRWETLRRTARDRVKREFHPDVVSARMTEIWRTAVSK